MGMAKKLSTLVTRRGYESARYFSRMLPDHRSAHFSTTTEKEDKSPVFVREKTDYGSIVRFAEHVSVEEREKALNAIEKEVLSTYFTERAGAAMEQFVKDFFRKISVNYNFKFGGKVTFVENPIFKDVEFYAEASPHSPKAETSKAKLYYCLDGCVVLLPVAGFKSSDLTVAGENRCVVVKGNLASEFGEALVVDETIPLPDNLFFDPDMVRAKVTSGMLRLDIGLLKHKKEVTSFSVIWDESE